MCVFERTHAVCLHVSMRLSLCVCACLCVAFEMCRGGCLSLCIRQSPCQKVRQRRGGRVGEEIEKWMRIKGGSETGGGEE